MDNDLKLAKLILDWWFSPWGAAKAAMGEDLFGDTLIKAALVRKLVYRVLDGDPVTRRKVQEVLGAPSP